MQTPHQLLCSEWCAKADRKQRPRLSPEEARGDAGRCRRPRYKANVAACWSGARAMGRDTGHVSNASNSF